MTLITRMNRHIPATPAKTHDIRAAFVDCAFKRTSRTVDRRNQFHARYAAFVAQRDSTAGILARRRAALEEPAAWRSALKDFFGGLLLVVLGWLCIHLLFSL